MMRWFDRTFPFTLPVGAFPAVLERLGGTPARLEEKIRGLKPQLLTLRDGEAWSIQEHAGHLWDLDELHAGRLDDYLAGAERLRPADLQNRKTFEADHNARPIGEILTAFRRDRSWLVRRLETFDEAFLARTALHPRLNQPMRVLDMALFVAEHDDHHLAVMTELARRLRS